MKSSCIIIAGQTRWQLAIASADDLRLIELPAADNPAEIASAIDAAMAAGHVSGSPTMLAIPSAWCLNASIATGDLPRNDRTAMLYRLEEKLPVAAETIAADFVESDGQALGVCIQVDRVKPLIDALESRHVVTQSISPIAFLAAQQQVTDTAIVLVGEPGGQQVSVLKIIGGVVQTWSLLPATSAAIARQLNFMALKDGDLGACVAIGVPEQLSQALHQRLEVKVAGDDAAHVACQHARKVLAGEVKPWVELRRGPLAIADRLRLHRSRLNFLLASILILLLASSAALFWRGSRYAKVDAIARQQMEDAFREHFPDWAVPENVRLIVESEHQKAVAAAGASMGKSTRSATRTLVDVLDHLPPEGRFSIDSMSFADHSFELQGRVRSLDALDPLLVAAKSAGMTVGSPEAHKGAGGMWTFAIRGSSEQSTPLAKGD